MFKKITDIFLDFDGVILDSVDCKTNAFIKIYEPYGDNIMEKVKNYHIKHGGISRFEKFKYWHKNFLGINISKKDIGILADQFSFLVLDNVVNSDEIPGSIDFIKNYYQKFNFRIITGTPQHEIELIVDRLKIRKYFKSIHGSPKKKFFWTEKIINDNKLNRSNILFVGDAMTDYHAAKCSSINFALVESEINKKLFSTIKVFKFSKFDLLEKMLINNEK